MRLDDIQLSQQVSDAVKRDDSDAFNKIAGVDNRCFSLCFGRFPVLSLCYLFNAKKIAAEHEKRFLAMDVFEGGDYLYADEPQDAYQKFKTFAGTNLRLYASGTVSPAEMLAVTRQTDALKRSFARLNPSGKARENIIKIYASAGKAARIEDGALRVAGEVLKRREKKALAIVSGAAAFFVLLFAILTAAVSASVGLGTEKNPARIKTLKQLTAAAKSDGNYILSADLTLPAGFEIADFKSGLDGGGHTLTATDTSLAQTVSGSIKNLTFVAGTEKLFAREITGRVENIKYDLNKFSVEVSKDFSFFAQKNSGQICDLSMSLDVTITRSSAAEEDISGAALVIENEGVISGGEVLVTAEITGSELGDLSFAVIAATNSGTIEDCQSLAESQIKSQSADIAGVVCENLETGMITDCTNAAFLRQTTAEQKWNPIAAGIAIANSGAITGCINKGDIYSVSNNAVAEAYAVGTGFTRATVYAAGIVYRNQSTAVISESFNQASINAQSLVNDLYSAGVAAVNFGEIKSCVNTGTISARAARAQNNKVEVNAAGIACVNNTDTKTGLIEKCKSTGDISVTSRIGIIYAAGITVFNNGDVVGCGAAGAIKCDSPEGTTVFAGGIISECYGRLVERNYSAMRLDVFDPAAGICSGGIIAFIHAYPNTIGGFSPYANIVQNYYVKRASIPQTSLGIAAVYNEAAGIEDNPWYNGDEPAGMTGYMEESEVLDAIGKI